ncbi:MAG: hypothetical protein KJS92_01970 [Bacteroidetes bacterium]|nr:hypothetical protein [Bacteroidota bacterium]
MNFFAHFFTDHQEARFHYNAGLVLPDLIRNFLPGKRFRLELVQQEHLNGEAHELFLGSCRHLERDLQFHRSDFFEQGEAELRMLFKEHHLGKHIPRVWLASHLVLELMLDRVLMKQYPDLLDRFYQSLESTETRALDQFLHASIQARDPLFHERWKRFVELKYLYHYTDDDAFTYSLMRIYMRAGVSGEWNAEARNAMNSLIPAAEACIFENLKFL